MAVTAKTTVSSKGQIVLPKAVRDRKHWQAGVKLIVEERDDGVLLRQEPKAKAVTIDQLYGALKYKGPRLSDAESDARLTAAMRKKFLPGQ